MQWIYLNAKQDAALSQQRAQAQAVIHSVWLHAGTMIRCLLVALNVLVALAEGRKRHLAQLRDQIRVTKQCARLDMILRTLVRTCTSCITINDSHTIHHRTRGSSRCSVC